MVKKIANITVILLLAVRLVTIPWSSGLTCSLTFLSTIIISIAAGFALSNLLNGGNNG